MGTWYLLYYSFYFSLCLQHFMLRVIVIWLCGRKVGRKHPWAVEPGAFGNPAGWLNCGRGRGLGAWGLMVALLALSTQASLHSSLASPPFPVTEAGASAQLVREGPLLSAALSEPPFRSAPWGGVT